MTQMNLTEEQLRTIAEHPDEPIRMTDPDTKKVYVLLPEETYTRVKGVLGDFSPADAYTAIDRAFAEGWDDPKMDDYDRYEEFRQ